MIGRTIAHYAILEKLGEGGMGVVYKARDTHLERVVALKVLLPEKVADAERKWRFIREAKAASALSHPNIITIYDIDQVGDIDFIVMEYVAGKTLDQVIPPEGLRLSEGLKYAIEIADALVKAHAAGIVHRDLKPGNVMVTPESRVKVLDFGLAKLTDPAGAMEGSAMQTSAHATAGVEQCATWSSSGHTQPGMVLGTAGYMSPEQAECKLVDARSDVFSFGALLYEIFTGRRAFHGDSTISIITAILRDDPEPVSRRRPDVPRDLEQIINRCLRKDPNRRYQHMDDIKVALEELKEESDSGRALAAAVPVTAKPARRSPRLLPALLLAATAVLGLVLFRVARREQLPQGPVLRRLTYDSGLTTDPALSPDGKLVAYASDRAGGGNLNIWMQQLAGGEAIRLTRDSVDDSEPTFSPDGSSIAFRSERAGGGIYVVPALGGEARLVAKNGRRPQFSPDGNYIAYWIGNPRAGDPYYRGAAKIYIIPLGGGAPRQLAADFDVAFSPTWAADGKHIVFGGKRDATGPRDFWVAPIDGGPAIKTGTDDAFAADGLVYANAYDGLSPRAGGNRFIVAGARRGDSFNLWQVELSPRTWHAKAPLARLTFGTGLESSPSGAAGSLVAFANITETTNLWYLPLDANRATPTGNLQQLTKGSTEDQTPAVSGDGKTLVFVSRRAGSAQVCARDLESGKETVVTATKNYPAHPVVSFDGSRIAYGDNGGPKPMIYVVSIGPGGQTSLPEAVCTDCFPVVHDWSPDGKGLLYVRGRPVAVGMLNLASREKSEILRHPTYDLWQAHFSPDGHWLAFQARTSPAQSQIFIVPYRGPSAPMASEWIPITSGEYAEVKPRWSPNGNVLYFASDRDGFRCISAQYLDARTKRPVGQPFPVFHAHTAQRSMSNIGYFVFEIAVTRDKLIFNMGERTGNIWSAQFQE